MVTSNLIYVPLSYKSSSTTEQDELDHALNLASYASVVQNMLVIFQILRSRFSRQDRLEVLCWHECGEGGRVDDSHKFVLVRI